MPRKSPAATESGLYPTSTVGVVAGENLPCPSFRRIDTVLSPELATARSRTPSPVKSPTAIEYGPLPTVTMGVGAGEKYPVPSPSRIATVPSWKLATAKSRCPLPKSPTAMENGSEPAPLPTDTGEPGNSAKFPVPSPFRIVTLPELLLATARSSFPSPLKSPAATDISPPLAEAVEKVAKP